MDISMDISMDLSMDIHIHGNPGYIAVNWLNMAMTENFECS